MLPPNAAGLTAPSQDAEVACQRASVSFQGLHPSRLLDKKPGTKPARRDSPRAPPYLGGILKGVGCTPVEINTEPDHAHILFLLSRNAALSEVVGNLKKGSNDWLRKQAPQFAEFFWQAGYGAFSVSQSQVDQVQAYIRNQREHHRVRSFQDEFRALLKAHDVEYDERYVWD